MKKLWILAIVLFAASAAVMAQDAFAEDELFMGIDAVALDMNSMKDTVGTGRFSEFTVDGCALIVWLGGSVVTGSILDEAVRRVSGRSVGELFGDTLDLIINSMFTGFDELYESGAIRHYGDQF